MSPETTTDSLISQALSVKEAEPLRAAALLREALHRTENDNHRDDSVRRGGILLDLCRICRKRADTTEGMKYSLEALRHFREQNNREGMSRACLFMGIFCFYTGLYNQAMRFTMEAHRTAEDLTMPDLIIPILVNMAEIYKFSGRSEDALTHYNRALETARKGENRFYQGVVFLNMGELHYINGHYDTAMVYMEKAGSYLPPSAHPQERAELLLWKARIYEKTGRLEEASVICRDSLTIMKEWGSLFYLIDCYLALYDISLSRGSAEFAWLTAAGKTAEKMGSDKKLAETEYRRHEFFCRTGDFENALKHFRNYHSLCARVESLNLIQKMEILKLEQDFPLPSPDSELMDEFLSDQLKVEKLRLEELERTNSILRKQAVQDELTGLPNRRRIRRELEEVTARSDRDFALLILDLDHFKGVNDTMGHLYGDFCLKEVSYILRRKSEEWSAFAGRYGGEEFLCLLPDRSEEEARRFAEDLRTAVLYRGLETDRLGERPPLTVSIGGYCSRRESPLPVEEALELADTALYRAKDCGRNSVSFH